MISVLGVDVGGTKIAVAPVDAFGKVLAEPTVAASDPRDTNSFVSGLVDTLRAALTEFSPFAPGGIGLACAGTIDTVRGTVVFSPNLPLVQEALGPILREEFGLPVVLENDANAATVAEATVGAAKGLRHVIMLTLGTGVGGGIFLRGQLYRGMDGGAGELGHVIVAAGGEVCSCGARGCLEMYASGPALARYARRRAGSIDSDPAGLLKTLLESDGLTGAAVSDLAKKDYVGAKEAVAELAEWLGVGLVNMTNVFDPQMIVVGGGVSDLGELLLAPAREFLRHNAMAPARDRVQVASAVLGNTAGVVGAGLSAWEMMSALPMSEPSA